MTHNQLMWIIIFAGIFIGFCIYHTNRKIPKLIESKSEKFKQENINMEKIIKKFRWYSFQLYNFSYIFLCSMMITYYLVSNYLSSLNVVNNNELEIIKLLMLSIIGVVFIFLLDIMFNYFKSNKKIINKIKEQCKNDQQ